MSLENAIIQLNASVQSLVAINSALIQKLSTGADASFVGTGAASLEVNTSSTGETSSSAPTEETKRKRRTKAEIEADRAAEEAAKKAQEVTETVVPSSLFNDEAPQQPETDLSFLGDDEDEAPEFREIKIEELRALARSLTSGGNAKENGEKIVAILSSHNAKTFPELQGDMKKHFAVFTEMSKLTIG